MIRPEDIRGMIRVYRGVEAGMRDAATVDDPESLRWWLGAREARERVQRASLPFCLDQEPPMT